MSKPPNTSPGTSARAMTLAFALALALALPATTLAQQPVPETRDHATMRGQEPVGPIPAEPESAAADSGTTAQRDVLVDGTVFEATLDRLLEKTAAAAALADADGVPKRTRESLRAELKTLRKELRALRMAVRKAPPGVPAVVEVVVVDPVLPPPERAVDPPVEPPVEPTAPAPPMERQAFDDALASLESHGFASEKLEVLEDLAAHNWFVVEQARRLLESFSFGKDRLQALERVAPRIVDPQNNFRLYEAFTFESDKKQARRILASQQR